METTMMSEMASGSGRIEGVIRRARMRIVRDVLFGAIVLSGVLTGMVTLL
jgi:hypothetical protein